MNFVGGVGLYNIKKERDRTFQGVVVVA